WNVMATIVVLLSRMRLLRCLGRSGRMKPGQRLIDVSHVIEHGLITYRGLPAPLVCDFLSREQSRKHYAPGVEFHIGKVEMVANTGTYLDAPFHRYLDGIDLAGLPLEKLADLDAVVLRWNLARGRAIGKD